MIYFVQCERAVKIGYTKNVCKRLGELQSANPHKLQLLVSVPGSRGLEAAFHRAFKPYKVRGEWFNLDVPSPLGKVILLLKCGLAPKNAADVAALCAFDLKKGSTYGPGIDYDAGLAVKLPPAAAGVDPARRNAAIRARALRKLGLTPDMLVP